MALELLSSKLLMTTNNVTQLQAQGGLPPYVFSLVGDGDGGSLLPGGLYQSPSLSIEGFQTIRVTDGNSDTDDLKIYFLNQIQLVGKIIQEYTGLEDGKVYIYNQKIEMPKDDSMYVAIGISSVKAISNNSHFDGAKEEIRGTYQATLSINVISKGLDALNRKEEVLASLVSMISQNIQRDAGFKIATIPTSFSDLSGLDGSAIPFRFNIAVNILYATCIIKDAPYYDTFNDLGIINDLDD